MDTPSHLPAPRAPSRFAAVPDRPQIGRTLAALRAARGWTQGALGEASGVDKAQISRYERGADDPSPRTLHALLDAFGTTTADFYHLMETLERLLDGERRREPPMSWPPEELPIAWPGLGGVGGAGRSAEAEPEKAQDAEVERLARDAGSLAARLVRLHFRRLKGGA